jgi:thioesterase domain-containing protein
VLHSVAGVRDVAVVQVAEQGALAAFVVATPGSDLDVDRLRGACEESLHPSVVPTRFKVCDVLPRSVNGKVDRRRLAEEAAAEATRGSSERAFEGSDLEEIARCMGDAIGRGPLGADEDFFAVGGDSLASIRLSIELERRFHRPVFPADLLKGRSPRMLAMLMHSRLDRERDTPILSLRDGLPGSERASTLVLVPGLGGSPLSFVPLARLLASGRRVFGATLPDGSADSAEISIESIAARAVEALPSAPCVHFVGYSMGVRIAFEAARRVTARGGRATLIVLDAAASLSGSGPRQWMRTAWAAARGRLRAAIAESPESPTSPVGGARARIRRSATIVRAAARRHVYEPSEIPMALLVSASTSGRRWSAADGEWSQVARLMMREVIPGDHLSIVAGDAIGTTAAAIDRAIEVLEREPARP